MVRNTTHQILYANREECSDCELVEEIVKDVYEKLFPTKQIGINSRLVEIEQLLCKEPWGIRRIGIWGMPGIGKTTLAKAVFDLMSGEYEASCFIKHFDKSFHEKGRHRLLKEHFRDVLEELPRECSRITRPSLAGNNLSKKRTLVVLDDVHNPLLAESFLGGLHWFGLGSLIIITSRDKRVFRLCQISHVYEVCSLDENEALQLFSRCAYIKDIREGNILKLSMEVIDYANGNPLALSYYGKELKGKRLSEMESRLLDFKLRTPYKIYDSFKISYETLNDSEKNIFLDIACFFNRENVEYVMQLLEGCGFFPHVGIDVLVEKCLVTISENRVNMHNLIQDFGRDMINKERIQIRSRLWEQHTIHYVLKDYKPEYEDHKGKENIEGISLDMSNLPFNAKPTAFEDMLSLRFLKIYCTDRENDYGLHLPNGLNYLPNELRLLHWDDYPLQSLPQDFDTSHLVMLDMSFSKLQKLWGETKNLDKLMTVRLNHSEQLTEIDHLCKAQNIELIDLQGCTKLQSFPATNHLQHLRVVNLSGCREITSFPEVSPNIKELHLQGTGIRELPISLGNATHLEILDLSDCSSLVKLPSSIGNAINLEELNLEYCSSLVELPSSFENVTNLKNLYVTGCSRLLKLPFSIGNSTNLIFIDLDEDNNVPIVTVSDNSRSMCIEVRRAKGRKFFVLKGERKYEGYIWLNLRTVYENEHVKNIQFPFHLKDDTASTVSSKMVEQLELTNLDVTFMAEMIDIFLVNLIPTWKTEVKVDHLIHSQLNQNEGKPQREKNTAFHDARESVSHSCPRSDEEDKQCVDAIKVEDRSSNQEAEEATKEESTKPVSLKQEEKLNEPVRLLDWDDYHFQSLPQDFDTSNLVELYMPYSQLQKLWGGTKNLKMLKMALLCYSEQLTEIDDLCEAQNIELIDLQGCTKLQSFPATYHLQQLRVVNLSGCIEITSFPEVSPNIEELHLRKTGIRGLPISIGNATHLKILDLSYCSSLFELPSSLGNATNLRKLYLTGCSSLVEVPASIGNATKLEKLDLSNCSSLVKLPDSIGNATNLKILDLTDCSNLEGLPSSIGNVTNLQKLNLENCSKLKELPSLFGNTLNVKQLYLAGCSSLVDLPSSIRNSTSLMSIDRNEDNNLPRVTFSDNSGSRCVEVRRTKKENIFFLKGERKDEHSVSLNLLMVDGNGRVKDINIYLFQKDDIASKVSREMVEKLGLTDEYITFIAELIDILLVNIIPNWETNVAVDHLNGSQLNQNEDKTQGQEKTAFHDVRKPVSHPWTSDFPQPDEEDEQYVDDIKVHKSSYQEVEEASEPVSLEEEGRLRQELEDIEAKYQEEMQEIMRKREEAMMEAKKKQSLMKKRTT